MLQDLEGAGRTVEWRSCHKMAARPKGSERCTSANAVVGLKQEFRQARLTSASGKPLL